MSRQAEQLAENIISQTNLIDGEKKNLQNLEVQVQHYISLHLLSYLGLSVEYNEGTGKLNWKIRYNMTK